MKKKSYKTKASRRKRCSDGGFDKLQTKYRIKDDNNTICTTYETKVAKQAKYYLKKLRFYEANKTLL